MDFARFPPKNINLYDSLLEIFGRPFKDYSCNGMESHKEIIYFEACFYIFIVSLICIYL